MKYILLSTTDNPTYLEFLPSVCEMWRNTYNYKVILGMVTNKSKNHKLLKEIENYVDELYIVLPKNNICSQALGKLLRFYLSKYHKNDICIVTDIDLYMIDMRYFEWIEQNEEFLENDKIITLGSNMYSHLSIAKYKNTKRFPVHGTSFKGSTIINLLDLDKYDSYENFIENLCYKSEGGILENIYGNESVRNFPFSDEALLVQLIEKKNIYNNIIYVDRLPITHNGKSLRRLDRSCHHSIKKNFIIKALKTNKIEDVCPPRPFNLIWLTPILDYLKIDKNKRILKNVDNESIGILGIKNPNAQKLFNDLTNKNKYVCFSDPKYGVGMLQDILDSNIIHVFDYTFRKELRHLKTLEKQNKIKLIIHT